MTYEYHVVGVITIDGIQNEANKRAAEGWRLVGISPEIVKRKRTILVFEKEKHELLG